MCFMEIGLIHPPVGLNIYIVNAIAPDVPVTKVMSSATSAARSIS